MDNEPYSKREIDQHHEYIKSELTTIKEDMRTGFDEVKNRLDYTNGKLKKIILAMVAVSAFTLGLGLKEAQAILALFL